MALDRSTNGSLSESELFELLTTEMRRDLIEQMHNHPQEEFTVEELAECIKTAAGSEERSTRALQIQLYQHHLPKMDDIDCIEFDRAEERVVLNDQVKLAAEVLNQTRDTLS